MHDANVTTTAGERHSILAPVYVAQKQAVEDPFGEDIPTKPVAEDPFGEDIPAKPAAKDPFGEDIPAKPASEDPFGEDVPADEPKQTPIEEPTETPADVPEEDPFEGVDDDLLPDFDEDEPTKDQQPEEPAESEPTLDDLFDSETKDDQPLSEDPLAEEPVTEEPSQEKMPLPEKNTDAPSTEGLFDNDDSESPTDTPSTESPPLEIPTIPLKEVETPAEEPLKKSLDDPFDEPTLDQLPRKKLPKETVEESLDKEIERRMDALDSNVLEPADQPEEDQPADSSNTPNIFDTPTDIEPQDDTDPTKLFGDSESLGIEIGEDVGPREFTDAEKKQQLELLAKEQQETQKNCNDEFAKLKSDRIGDIDLSLRFSGNPGEDYPYDCTIDYGNYQPRQWAQITYNWKASGLCHKPLYFEQVQLERYGHSWGPYVQPIMSGVHFFGTLPILPYKMGLKAPNECVYTLGYYRPGNCAPYLVGGVPFTWRAALYQGGVTTGLIFAIP